MTRKTLPGLKGSTRFVGALAGLHGGRTHNVRPYRKMKIILYFV